MSPFVVLAVVVAAVLHAWWNALAKRSTDRLTLMARMSVIGTVASLTVLVLVDVPAPPARPWLACSVLVHAAYTLLLTAAYRVADFNQAYPLARGIGPAVVGVFAVAVLGETLPGLAALGIVLIVGATAAIGLTPWRRVVEQRSALATAALTGLAISTYTVIDGIGVRASGDPIGYAAWLVAAQGLVIALLAVLLRRATAQAPAPADHTPRAWASACAAGCMSVLAYGLVLWAQARGALAGVAALRETSIVFGAVIGGVLLREPMGRFRVGASCVIASGAVLLAVSGLGAPP
jgi:drug/metabolite transporter (DMT)-like permease